MLSLYDKVIDAAEEIAVEDGLPDYASHETITDAVKMKLYDDADAPKIGYHTTAANLAEAAFRRHFICEGVVV
jgi:hypothetical protein